MTDAGHPSRHGYSQCALCATWRPTAELDAGRCADVPWCSNQARVGTGMMDADTGERNRAASARSHLDPRPGSVVGESSATGQPGALGGIPRGPVLNQDVGHE